MAGNFLQNGIFGDSLTLTCGRDGAPFRTWGAEKGSFFLSKGCLLGYPWFLCYMPYMPEGGTESDYSRIRIYKCGAYPNRDPKKRQVITYVINAWKFASITDRIGSEQIGPSKITAF